MYCKHCGAVLDDDALFCESCGKAVSKRNTAENTDRAAKEIYPAEKSSPETAGRPPEGQSPDTGGRLPEGQSPETAGRLPEGQSPETAGRPPEGQSPDTGGRLPEGQNPEAAGRPPEGQSPEAAGRPSEGQSPETDGRLPEGQNPETGSGFPEGQSPEKKKKINPVLIAIAGVVAAAVIAAVVLAGGKQTPSTPADVVAQNNFNNGAIFAYDDTRLYFVSSYEGKGLETNLYSTDYSGGDKKLLSSDDNIKMVRVTGGKLLFSFTDDDKEHFSVAMMNTDGTEETVITEADAEITAFDMYGKELLYVSEDKLHSCSLDGDNDTVLLPDVKTFIVAGGTIYYASSDGVYSYVKKSQKSTKITDGETKELCCKDGRLYYKRDKAYYMTDEKGNEKKLIDDALVNFMLFRGDYIYFIRMFNKDELDMYLGEGWTETTSLYLAGVGTPIRIPEDGGAEEASGTGESEKVILGTTLFGYPEGMYTRMSIVLNVLDPVENDPFD